MILGIHSAYSKPHRIIGISIRNYLAWLGGARGVIVIVEGNGCGDTSSNPGRDWLHFT